LIYPRWEKSCTVRNQENCQPAANGEAGLRETPINFSDYRIWNETAKGEEQIGKAKSIVD
jgi:hypothetical protein